jgi:flagellar basal-body rod modification protein FlgD
MFYDPMSLNNSTSPLAGALQEAAAAGSSASGLSGLDGSQFMAILLAQLRNQNPLEPMQDKDMMAQMTQLNSLMELRKIEDALQSMVQSSQLSSAAVLVGKTVQVRGENGEIEKGKVSGVSMTSGKVMLQVNNKQVALTSLVSVVEDEPATKAISEKEKDDEPIPAPKDKPANISGEMSYDQARQYRDI